MNLSEVILPELVLIAVACGLFLLGTSTRVAARRAAAWIALAAVIVVVLLQGQIVGQDAVIPARGGGDSVEVGPFANYVKLVAAIVGVLLVLLAWPTNREATGSRSLEFGHDAGEFYGLMLLALAGLMLVAGANDLMLLFLGIELASIPTYIMVSMLRPIPAAQEAGVKYFFLGAMAAAIMLFGFSYLYGTTGLTKLSEIRAFFNPVAAGADGALHERAHAFTQWQVLAICLLLAGFAFKIAAVPLHAYVGDVYQGAATPVTAFLAFVPKTSGFVAIVKTLVAVGGADWRVPPEVVNLLWVLAILTMTVGNTLGLLQHNVKRVLAYSSIAHSGYMLVGVTALVAAGSAAGLDDHSRGEVQRAALAGVLFYLAAYGIMNTGAFGVLMLLPSHEQRYDRGDGTQHHAPPATSAETYEDLAGVGRRNLSLGLAMAVCCLSLIGMPLTVGFFAKLYLIRPALDVGSRQMNWLVVLTVANAAIGAAYYLRIVATMFLRPEPAHVVTSAAHPHPHGYSHDHAGTETGAPWWASAVGLSITISVVLTLLLGSVFGATNRLVERALGAAGMETMPAATGSTDTEHPVLTSARP